MAAYRISPEMQSKIRRIQEVFAEHRTLSYEEWEDGFLTDMNPEQEISIWLDAADTYVAFTKDESDALSRKDVYKVIAACLTGIYEYAIRLTSNKLKPLGICHEDAQKIVNYYYRLREVRWARNGRSLPS